MSFISRAIKKLKGFFNKLKSKGGKNQYDFLVEADKAFDGEPNKSTAALRYLKDVLKDKSYSYKPNQIKGGELCWFNYHDPLLKETLPWWDREPLVIFSSSFTVQSGQKRVLGLNMHLLPPHIRVLVFAEIFSVHRNSFLQNFDEKRYTFSFLIRNLYPKINKYGGDFAIRMYAPSQITKLKRFPIEEWGQAIHIPSRRYQGTNLVQLNKLWKAHMNKK
jgi:hypothetical protein